MSYLTLTYSKFNQKHKIMRRRKKYLQVSQMKFFLWKTIFLLEKKWHGSFIEFLQLKKECTYVYILILLCRKGYTICKLDKIKIHRLISEHFQLGGSF